MSEPARHEGKHEKNGIHISGKTHGSVYYPVVKVHIRVDPPRDKVLVISRDPLDLKCYLYQRLLPTDLEHFQSNFLGDGSPWIVGLIDPVAKPKQNLLFLLDLQQKFIDIGHTPDLLQHANHRRIRPAVPRPVQRARRSSNRREDIGSRRDQMPQEGGRTIHLVFRVDNEQHLKGPDQFGMRGVTRPVKLVQHVQKIRDIPLRVIGRTLSPPDPVPVTIGSQRRHHPQQHSNRLISGGRVAGIGHHLQGRLLRG